MCVSVDLTHSLFVLRPMLWVVTHIGWIVEAAQADAHCRSEAGQGGQKYAEEERVNKYKDWQQTSKLLSGTLKAIQYIQQIQKVAS